MALRILEQPEDYPAVLAEQQSVRSYPRPFGINLAHVLGYLSPITADEYDAAQEDGDTSVNGASVVGRAGVEQQYDRWLRGMPGYRTVAVDSMGRVLGDDSEVAGQPGDTLVTSIDAKVQGVVERQLADTITTARATYDEVTAPQLRRRLRRRGGDGGEDRPGGRDGQPADVRPLGLGRRHQQGAARAALLAAGRQPAAGPGHAGAVRPRLDLEAGDDGQRPQQRVLAGHPTRLLLGRAGRQPAVQELRVGVPTATSTSRRPCSTPATPSSTASG